MSSLFVSLLLLLKIFIFVEGIKNPSIAFIYVDANEDVDKNTRLFIKYANKVYLPLTICPAFVTSYQNYYFSDQGNDSFKLMFVAW